jgi:hypothetical protein
MQGSLNTRLGGQVARVILQPSASGTHGGFRRLSELKPVLSEAAYSRLEAACPGGKAIVWGKTKKWRSQWQEIEEGDTVLFYHRRQYFSRAEGAGTAQSETAPSLLWGDDSRDSDGFLLDHLILYRNPASLHLPGEHLNKALGYTPQYSLRRFMVLDVDKSSRVRGLLNGKTA